MPYWSSKCAAKPEPVQPSLGMIDSQSVKQAQKGQLEQGEDGYKKIKGRKRHVVVDVLGLMLGCFVSAANVADGKAAPAVLVPVLELYGQIEKVLALPSLPRRVEQLHSSSVRMCRRAHSTSADLGLLCRVVALDCGTNLCAC